MIARLSTHHLAVIALFSCTFMTVSYAWPQHHHHKHGHEHTNALRPSSDLDSSHTGLHLNLSGRKSQVHVSIITKQTNMPLTARCATNFIQFRQPESNYSSPCSRSLETKD